MIGVASIFVGNCFVGGNSVLSMSMNGIQAVSMILAGSLPPIIFCAVSFNNLYIAKIVRKLYNWFWISGTIGFV